VNTDSAGEAVRKPLRPVFSDSRSSRHLDSELLIHKRHSIFEKESGMHSVAWWPTLIVVAVATFTDLRSRRIPNWLVLPFLVAGLVVSGWTHGWHGVLQSLEGLAVGALFFGILCWMGGMGMGDVKLCAAIGAWIGPSQMLTALVMTGIAGGLIALCWAVAGGFVGEMFSGTGDLIFGLKKRGLRPHPELVLDNPLTRKMPYAPAIAIGTLFSFFSR
jgi:prepilin peptidase CpaA